MKKRIIGLILVVAMAVLALAGCGYSYQDDDLTKYATFDVAKFKEALGELSIKDGDFTMYADIRAEKVQDEIFTTLASSITEDGDKLEEGTLGKYDVVYYCCYYTADIDGETKVFGFIGTDDKNDKTEDSPMAPGKAVSIQLGLNSLEDMKLDLSDKLIGKDIKDYIYEIDTTTKVAADTTVIVSYTIKAPTFVDGEVQKDSAGEVIYEETSVSYVELVIPAAAESGSAGDNAKATAKSFAEQLVGKKVASALTDSFTASEVLEDGQTYDVTYSGVTVHWTKLSGDVIATTTETTYKSTKNVEATDGETYDLKDKELTYHYLPVYYYDVAETLSAEILIKDVYGSISLDKDEDEDGEISDEEKGTFDCITSDMKNGETSVTTIIDKINDLIEDIEKAKEEEDKESSSSTGADKDDDEKEEEDKPTLEEQLAAEIDKLLGCAKEGETADAAALEQKMIDEYEQEVYDALEEEYEAEISENLGVKVFAAAKKYTTFKYDENGRIILPWDQVNEAYTRNYEYYKYQFYQGSVNKVYYYDTYNGDFDAFLKKEVAGSASATMQNVYDVIGAEAEAYVQELIMIYSMGKALDNAGALSDEDNTEINEHQYANETMVSSGTLAQYESWGIIADGDMYYTERNDLVHAYVLDNIMDYILEIKEKEEDDTNLKVEFERDFLKYEFEETEEE